MDSYLWSGGGLKKDFNKLSPQQKVESVNFAQLLALVAQVSPELRIRFSTSHPKDMTDEVLHTMASMRTSVNIYIFQFSRAIAEYWT